MAKKVFVALLRGINVGGNNIIKMADLRTEFERLGFSAVKTYIQSGNVIFECEETSKLALETKIEKALAKRFHYTATVLVRSQKDIENTVAHFPALFKDLDWKHNVIFLGEEIDSQKILAQLEIKPDLEKIAYISGVLFWSAKLDTITRSNMLKLSTRKEYQKMTVRNQNTTRKLAELMSN